MSKEEMIYTVRKHGELIVGSLDEAKSIVEYAKEVGYSFKAKIRGWNYIVSDEDF